MTSNTSPTDTSRFRGCTLTGALSVTTHVRDAVSVIHGPKGCSHHNVSLLHATGLENPRIPLPDLISTALSETDIIFGGEESLKRTLEAATGRDVRAVFVLSTCIIDTIGDDVHGVCGGDFRIPVIPVPTAGFLGGTFQNGVNNALIAIAGTVPPCRKDTGINIIGERNLEYEVEENYREIHRILTNLGLAINIRFVHTSSLDQISFLGAGRLNILREPGLIPVGEYLRERFGTPYIASFPMGLSGTLSFIETVSHACGINGKAVAEEERFLQEEILDEFSDIRDTPVVFDQTPTDPESVLAAEEAAGMLQLKIGSHKDSHPLPAAPSVGTHGVRRMLHRWRRAIHA
ncbi:nitrogenase component 1 [uncultured Methanoregula sp.]|uniref:nitrogenase component 1 n=1 Tax=uncultured Methanoregula sp. TaxID=1005933 RepID=UPI002AAAE4B4|nr:nitrogenase component 1 [uncultured Methanoregula sp.]